MSRRPGDGLTCGIFKENGLRATRRGEWQRAGVEKASRGQKVRLDFILKATGSHKGLWSDLHFKKMALPLASHTMAEGGYI